MAVTIIDDHEKSVPVLMWSLRQEGYTREIWFSLP